MSTRVKQELLPRLRQRYVSRGKEGKSRILDELCEQWGYDRKHAIKLMSGKVGWGGQLGAKIGRPNTYGSKELEVIAQIWKLSEQPCGKRLKALLPQWMPYYQKHFGQLESKVKNKVLKASGAPLDRLLKAHKPLKRN